MFGSRARRRKASIRDAFGPVVLVVSTPLAEQTCQASALAPWQLLQPFSEVPHTNAAGEASTVRVRFVPLASLEQPSVREAQRTTGAAVAAESISAQELADLERAAEIRLGETPWFDSYRRAFFGLIRPSDHEYLNHPVAVLALASTGDADPVAALEALYRETEAPEVFRQLHMNPALPKYSVLLHDAGEASLDQARAVHADARAALGEDKCCLLTIVSAAPAPLFAWSPFRSPRPLFAWSLFRPPRPPGTEARR